MHGVCAFTDQFSNDVPCVIYCVKIVASTTKHGVCACPAIKAVVTIATHQCVGGGITRQCIGQRVARAIDGLSACECQALSIVSKAITDGGLHCIRAASSEFDNNVPHVIDDVDIVAATAAQSISTRTAI